MLDKIEEFWFLFSNWITELGIAYDVDPYIFAFFYIGLAPVVWISAALSIKAVKMGKSASFPITICTVTFLSPYLYVMFAGDNIPAWAYLLIVAVSTYGLLNIWQNVRINRENISV